MADVESGLGDGAFGGSPASRDTSAVTATVALRLDKSVARLWMTTYDELAAKVKKLRNEIKELNVEANKTTSAIAGLTSGGGSATSASTTTAAALSAASAASKASATGKASGKGGGGGLNSPVVSAAAAAGGPEAEAALMAAKAALAIVNKIKDTVNKGINMIDTRTDRGYQSALVNDRQSVMYQQMYGVTQQQNYNTFRQPLNNYRLGPGGINAMLQLQASTGLQANKMAPSVEAIRAITGYGMSTGTVNNMIANLASPAINNRLTMTLGTGIYGPGGKQRTPMSVIQAIVRGAGLTNEKVVKGAMQPGSMTRARLTAMGVPDDMQDVVIQYAMENIQYQKKTGGKQGMYNPSNRDQLKTMGIDKNLATEKEVTDTKKELRDEHFYDKQKDNYASMERNTQKMETLTMKIEDLTSAITGARISSRGNPITVGIGKIFGALNPFGDPVEKGKSSKATQTSSGSRGASRVPSNINNKFGDRLQSMMAERPGVSIGQGFRSSADQRTMFLARYSKTSEKTGVYWEGSYWKKHSGVPDAAPPGMSMHELGLAADLHYATKADENWVQQNAARFGLKTIASINEPWHVQPAELPNSRREYEKGGAIWGRGPSGAAQFPFDATFEGNTESNSSNLSTTSAIQINSQMSISDSITFDRTSNRMKLGGGGAGGRMVTLRTASGSHTNSEATPPAGLRMKHSDKYNKDYWVPDRAFTTADWEAIATNESGVKGGNWRFRTKGPTFAGGLAMHRDNWVAYGGLEFGPRNSFEQVATESEQIMVANRAAFTGWTNPDTKQFTAPAGIGGWESVRNNLIKWPSTSTQGGDPVEGPSRGGGNKTVVMGGGGITIAPNIYVQSTGNNTADANRIAQEIADIVARRVKTTALRSM